MNLLQLCDPLFQYICRFNRAVRKGASQDLKQVRAEIKAMLAEMRGKAGSTPGLLTQFEKIELPLMFFVDFTIKAAPAGSGSEWSELAFERNELAGDEKFFDLLDETIADRSEAASERLAIFYTCMGLGFTGWYTGQPEYLRRKMLECSSRLRGLIEVDQASRICAESYENVNTANLIEPPSASLVGIGIALVGLAIVLLVANAWLYRSSSQQLVGSLKQIQDEIRKPEGSGK